MNINQFLIAAISSIGLVVVVGIYSLQPAVGIMVSVVVIALAWIVPVYGPKIQKKLFKAKPVRFILDVKGTTYLVELLIIIKGSVQARQRFKTTSYWLSVIRIPDDKALSEATVEEAILDCAKAAIRNYIVSTPNRSAKKSEVLGVTVVRL